jgi:hypothetical protein
MVGCPDAIHKRGLWEMMARIQDGLSANRNGAITRMVVIFDHYSGFTADSRAVAHRFVPRDRGRPSVAMLPRSLSWPKPSYISARR